MFDIEKLKWMQREYRNRLPEAEQASVLMSGVGHHAAREIFERSPAARADVLERFALGADLNVALEAGEFDFYVNRPTISHKELVWKKDNHPDKIPERLRRVVELLKTIPENDFLASSIKESVWAYAESEGRGSVLWPMRYALSGRAQSPDPFILAEALGKAETLARLEAACHILP